jgi:LmbE family N-acetylglucosaminyl deacetylase
MAKLSFREDDRILVVASHADDEMIGCGGLILNYGKQTDLLVVTDGRFGYSDRYPKEEIVRIRKEEMCRIYSVIELGDIFELDLPDTFVSEHKAEIMEFDMTGYDAVFIPNRHELHKDHSALYPIITELKKRQQARFRLFEYEIWTPLREYNYYLDITDVIEKKCDAVSMYESQMYSFDYISMIKGLNGYRGTFFWKRYAEVYYEVIEESIPA